jgi:hypothetical protein
MVAAIRTTVVGATTADAVVRPVELSFPNRRHYWWRFPLQQKYQPREGADFGNAAEAGMRANSKVTAGIKWIQTDSRIACAEVNLGVITETDVLRSEGGFRGVGPNRVKIMLVSTGLVGFGEATYR